MIITLIIMYLCTTDTSTDQPLSDGLLVSEGVIDVVVPIALPSGRYYYCVLSVSTHSR